MNRRDGSAIHRATCRDEICSYCENLAEERAYDWGDADDWQLGQTQYERDLDRMGGEER